MAMKMTLTANSDWMKLYLYATQLAFDNGIDLPSNIDDWSSKKLLKYIAKTEKEYGQLSAIL